MSRLLAIALLLAGCGGRSAAATTPPSSDPCRGGELTLEAVLDACRVASYDGADPAASDLRVTIDPVEVRSGETARVWVTFENVSVSPLALGFASPPAFTPAIFHGEDRVDLRAEVGGFGILGALASSCWDDCVAVAFTLEPGGRLRAYVDVAARVSVLTPSATDETAVDERDGGGIAPGTYELVVSLPYADAHPELEGTRIAREARAPFVVTP